MAENPGSVVAVMAPLGADAANIRSVLNGAGYGADVCRHPVDLRDSIGPDCGAVVLTEEALTPQLMDVLSGIFAVQPAWSDIPVVLIVSGGIANSDAMAAAKLRGPRRTITLLERPLRSATLVATLHTVMAARHRQYEIRDLLKERDLLLGSLEERVAERTRELQKMVEEMEAFSYSVSHDLRSPLRSLAGYAQALQEDFAEDLPPAARAYLAKIERAAKRMDLLTQDVLAYTRVSRGGMEIGTVDLDVLVADVLDQYQFCADEKWIEVQRPLGRVRGHVPSLVQCFSNLLGNAVKFASPGQPPRVRVSATQRDGLRRVSIQDNGIGIETAHQARIFRMFERAAGKQIPGTGIGLAIVKKAVERMGGAVGVISTPGHGAEFWLELVAAEEPRAGARVQPAGVTTEEPKRALALTDILPAI